MSKDCFSLETRLSLYIAYIYVCRTVYASALVVVPFPSRLQNYVCQCSGCCPIPITYVELCMHASALAVVPFPSRV